MSKIIPIGAAILLTACGAAITANNAAESAPQKSARQPARPSPPQSTGDGWSGTYTGRFDGGDGTVEISALGGNAYHVEVGTFGQGTGCSGGTTGTARAQGDRLELIVQNDPQLSQGGQCRVLMTRQGARLTVGEDNCLEHHGMSCNFEGSVTRRGEAAAAPPPRTASAAADSSWIVGAWVPGGTGTCGGEGWVLNANGSYADLQGSGRWSMTGNTLTLTMTARIPPDGDITEEIPVRPARITRSLILHHNLGTFSVRYANGRVGHFVRCR